MKRSRGHTDASHIIAQYRQKLHDLQSVLYTAAQRRLVAGLFTSKRVEFEIGLVSGMDDDDNDGNIFMEVTSYQMPNKEVVERLKMTGFELVATEDAGSKWKLGIPNQICLLTLCYQMGRSLSPDN